MTYRGPFQPQTFCDSVTSGRTGSHEGLRRSWEGLSAEIHLEFWPFPSSYPPVSSFPKCHL